MFGPTLVNGTLWDDEKQRVIIGILVEKLGGECSISEAEFVASPAASGSSSLYVELNPSEGKFTLKVVKNVTLEDLKYELPRDA